MAAHNRRVGMQQLLPPATAEVPDLLLAGWEEPGPGDVRGPTGDTGTPVWPGCTYTPPAGAVRESQVFVQPDCLGQRYRRRDLLVYPTIPEARCAFGEAAHIIGEPRTEVLASGVAWSIEVGCVCWPDGDELHVLGWATRAGVALAGGACSAQFHRQGRALLISVDSGWGIGYDAAVAADRADRASLAPGLAGLAALGRC